MKIVFEDEYFLAVDKPSGLVVHGDGRTQESSLVDWVVEYFENLGGRQAVHQADIGNPHTLDSGRYTKRYGIVNRLDRETSGLILIAKTNDAFINLQKQFLERSIKKEYIAKVWGEINISDLLQNKKIFQTENKNLFKIVEPISRHKKDPRIWVCGSGVGERATKRDAETDLEVVLHQEGTPTSMLIRLFPKTGRTHQLRLHARFLGHPIVGDKKYGILGITNEHGTEQIETLLPLLLKEGTGVVKQEESSRLMLHAKSVELIHPIKNILLKIETDLPEDF